MPTPSLQLPLVPSMPRMTLKVPTANVPRYKPIVIPPTDLESPEGVKAEETNNDNLSIIYLILVIIGGSFFSTSSGLRFLKIYSLTKYSLNQILSFSKPKNIFINKLLFYKINFDFNEINKYFLTVIIFIISLFVFTSILSISGIDFETSFKLAILTLMNTVNSSAYGLGNFDFQNLHFFTKYFMIFFMIIGRVELLTLLIIAKKFLFKY